MGKQIETQDFWVWNRWRGGKQGPRKITAVPAGGGTLMGQKLWIVVSDDPLEQGRQHYEGTSCFRTPEACIAYAIRDAESSVTSAQQRLVDVRRIAGSWEAVDPKVT